MKKLILLMTSLAAPCLAAETQSGKSLQDELNYLQAETYVYSASKHSQQISKAPASISIVSADQIKKYGYRTFGELLGSLKGFYNTYDRSYGFAGTRGFGRPSDFNNRLLLLIDGHRFNENLFDSFDSSEWFPVDMDTIERVEIVRGPGAALYGSNAVFGVINVITKHGKDLKGGNIKSSYGSFDATKTSLSYGNQFASGVEASVTGSFYNSHGNKRLYYKEFDAPETNNGISENNDKDQSQKLLATVSYQDFTFQALFDRRKKNVPTAPFGTIFNSPDTTSLDEATYFDLKYEHAFADQLTLLSRVSYNNYRYHGHSAFYSDNEIPIVDSSSFSRGQWWRAELELSKVLWDDHRITLGGEFQHNFDQYLTESDIYQTYYNVRTHSYRWAVFVQDEYSITKNLTANLGLRFDYFSNFGPTVNPRGSLIYDVWDNTTVKLLYGSAFRAPNQSELSIDSSGPTLKPEKFKTIELILEHRFNKQLTAELNVFHTTMTDLIDYGITGNTNVGSVKSIGMEAQIEGKWTNGWQSRFSYSWQETINKQTQQRLSNSPEHMVKLNVIAPLWDDKVFAGFETQYMSSRKTPEPFYGKVHGHVIGNLTLFSQQWPIKGLELSGGVYNLFNQKYFDPASSNFTQSAIQQDGLTFRIKASFDF